MKGSTIIFDADAIYYLSQHPHLFSILKDYKVILTPNWKELALLRKYIDIPVEEILNKNPLPPNQSIIEIDVPHKYDFSMVIKGKLDLIIGKRSFIVGTQGGLKRCGGVGDILAGVTAPAVFWNFEYGMPLASMIVRMANNQAWKKEGRGVTAPCVIRELSSVVNSITGEQ